MKKQKKINTPQRNCLYCKHYNSLSNTCTAPRADLIMNFSPKKDADCILLKYDVTEKAEINSPDFVSEFCKGKKCPYYFETHNLCTRPSKCPYKENKISNEFNNIKFNKDI